MNGSISLTESTGTIPHEDRVIIDECKLDEVLDVLQSCLKENFKAKKSSSYFVYDEEKKELLFAVNLLMYQ